MKSGNTLVLTASGLLGDRKQVTLLGPDFPALA